MIRRKSSRSKKAKQTADTPANSEDRPLTKQELAARKRQIARTRKEVIQTVVTAGTVGLLIAAALFVVKGAKLAVVGWAGVIVLALSYKYPRQALWAFAIYMPFAGTITYTVGGNEPSPIFQLAKDGFYIPALVAFYQQWRKQRLPLIVSKALKPTFYTLLTVCGVTFLLVNCVQQFSSNPQGKPILMAILGLKVLIGYIPLLPCVYYLLRNKKEFLFFTRLHLVLALACCFLGLVQYLLLSRGICVGTRNLEGADLFRASIDARCYFGGSLLYSPQVNMIRLPGTFVAPWQWAWFLISNIFVAFASAFSDPSLWWRIAGMAGMVLVFVNSAISGQRIALLVVPFMTVVLLFLTGQITNIKRFIPIGAGLVLILGVAVVAFPDIIEERVQSTIDRWNASPPTEFIAHQAEFTSKSQQGLFGNGLGRATNSARVFGDTQLIETYHPKVFYEIGPFGLIAVLAFYTAVMVQCFKAYRSVRDPSLRTFGASYWVFILFISYDPYYYPLDVDPVAVYYWMFAGLVLKIPEIERQEQEKAAQLNGDAPEDSDRRSKKKKRRRTKRS